jgi:hypothetical protein
MEGKNTIQNSKGITSREEEQLTPQAEQQLKALEQKWVKNMGRFTSPLPTEADTMRLLESVNKFISDEKTKSNAPDYWAEIDNIRKEQSVFSRITDLFRSQWNVYGWRSWIITILLMVIAGAVAGNSFQYDLDQGLDFWIQSLSFIMIGAVGYAFRPRNEGMAILQQLGHYTLEQQVLARFILVLMLQLVIAVLCSALFLWELYTFSLPQFVLSWTTTMLFFAVTGFVLIHWLGIRVAMAVCVIIWSGQLVMQEKLTWAKLFVSPASPYFIHSQGWMLGISAALLLLFFAFKKKGLRYE